MERNIGKKLQFVPDPELAETHTAGAKVLKVQPALHERYGALQVVWPRYWVVHIRMAIDSFNGLIDLDARIHVLPVDSAQMRTIDEESLGEDFYRTGINLVTNTVLAAEHLTVEIEREFSLPTLIKANLNERLRRGLREIQFREIATDPAYACFTEVQQIRDAVMHPSQTNVYNSTDWAQVPIAWMVSDRCLKATRASLELLTEMASLWKGVLTSRRQTVTLNVVRGIRSRHAVKKPPKR